jgi:Asp-tRNA(Asn)/Glu-tRNA(Gln) amidotransferase A subunit family amidase
MRLTQRPTCADYTRAYGEGAIGPAQVIEAALEGAEQAQYALSAFVALDHDDARAQAAASQARWEAGAPLGPLDGVPIPIKDAFDVRGYATTDGTTFMGNGPVRADATLVARLRAAGAIIFGKASLHEIGLGGTGINPRHITARNPYAQNRFTGGSSSGSGAIVAAGLAPLALGSDAGGSIRIPAALCGVYGLKPTYGRIPTTGGALLCWSLDHVGPLATSLDDLALFLDATAGHDGIDPVSANTPAHRPLRHISGLETPAALRLAWAPALVEAAPPAIRAAFRLQLEALRAAGVQLTEITFAQGHLHQPVGYITMASEAAASQSDWLRTHRAEYALDTRMLLAVGEQVSAVEYLRAQQVRRLIAEELGELCARFDGYISPTTGCTAGVISAAALAAGEVHAEINAEVSRFTFLANLTGFPALSLPVAHINGLPIGLQITCSPWAEARLLAIGHTLDPLFAPLAAPSICHSPIRAAQEEH